MVSEPAPATAPAEARNATDTGVLTRGTNATAPAASASTARMPMAGICSGALSE